MPLLCVAIHCWTSNLDSAADLLQLNKSQRLAMQRAQGRVAYYGNAAESAATGASATVAHPDVLVRGDFVSEELSMERGRDAFSKLVNVEHIKTVLFELEASALRAHARPDVHKPLAAHSKLVQSSSLSKWLMHRRLMILNPSAHTRREG